jgi:hypothetical protein
MFGSYLPPVAKDLELSGECGHNNLQSGVKKKYR